MTVKELINELKKIKEKDSEVYLVKDWEQSDGEGHLTDLYRLNDVTYQFVLVDMGMDWKEEKEVLLCFDEERATAKINKDYED